MYFGPIMIAQIPPLWSNIKDLNIEVARDVVSYGTLFSGYIRSTRHKQAARDLFGYDRLCHPLKTPWKIPGNTLFRYYAVHYLSWIF